MRITLINQTFHPDVASSGQHLTDLAVRLAERGHEVTVITSRRAYDNPETLFPRSEKWRGIRILRIYNTGFGKGSKWRRAVDFSTFILSCCLRLAALRKQQVMVAMTSPPIVSFIGAVFARLSGSRFFYWVMDLNPDEALAAGWLKPGSLAATWLEACSRFSLRSAASVIVLDEFMRKRVLDKGIPDSKVVVIPPWSHDAAVHFDASGGSRFRDAHGLQNKFVVMYSGNHSPCHPLDTILHAAEKLSHNPKIAFCFVGGGSEFKRVQAFARERQLKNIVCLSYQPMNTLAGSLSAADLHLVVMGEPFVGLVHPCKIYNIMRVGSPLLYVGPEPSHISKILSELASEETWGSAGHGESDRVADHILRLAGKQAVRPASRLVAAAERFSVDQLLPNLVRTLEGNPIGE